MRRRKVPRMETSPDREDRLDALSPLTPNISVSTRLDRETPPRRGGTRTRLHAPVSSIQQRRRETSSFDAVPTQPWRLGGLFVFVRPLEGKKSLGIKKGVSTPALHGSSNAENKHGNRHPPSLSRPLAPDPSPINKGFFFSMPFRRCKRHGPAKEFGARGELANFY